MRGRSLHEGSSIQEAIERLVYLARLDKKYEMGRCIHDVLAISTARRAALLDELSAAVNRSVRTLYRYLEYYEDKKRAAHQVTARDYDPRPGANPGGSR